MMRSTMTSMMKRAAASSRGISGGRPAAALLLHQPAVVANNNNTTTLTAATTTTTTRSISSSATPHSNKHEWWCPTSKKYKYWNRNESAHYWNREETAGSEKGKYFYLLDISPDSIKQEAKILSLSDPEDDANRALHESGKAGQLPQGASLVGVGSSIDDFHQYSECQPNVLFVSPSCPHTATVLPQVLEMFPSITWVHCRSAGIDFIESEQLVTLTQQNEVVVTNAKGQFSSSLAEYVLMTCAYFAKDLPRLMRNQNAANWESYNVEELRGKTMGIIGYGDIGRATAKLASEYGMRIVALRRHPFLSKDDPLCDVVYGRDRESRNKLMAESDYIVCSAPSTVETRGLVSAEAFDTVNPNAVFINLGRGPVVDEAALLSALKEGRLKGAAMDVFTEEPLPADSEFWKLPNILISPHNMDQTATFMHEATDFFLMENLPRFLCGEELLNPVDPKLGY